MTVNKKAVTKLLSLAFKVSLLVAIVYYLMQSGRLDFSKFIVLLEHPFLLASILFCLMVPLDMVGAWRWYLLLRALGVEIRYWRLYQITWIALLYSTILPGSISADLVRAYFVHKSSQSKLLTPIVTSMVIDRMSGLFGVILFAYVGSLVLEGVQSTQVQSLVVFSQLMLIGMLAFWGLMLLPSKPEGGLVTQTLGKLPFSGLTLKVYGSFRAYRHHKGVIFYSILIALLGQLTLCYLFWAVLAALNNAPAAPSIFVFVVPLGSLATTLPFTPGGLGVGHAAYEYLFMLNQVPNGANAFNIYALVRIALSLFGVIAYLKYKHDVGSGYDQDEAKHIFFDTEDLATKGAGESTSPTSNRP